MPPTQIRNHLRLIAELTLVALLAFATVVTLQRPARGQGFTIDESRWISTSRYFWITFLERDLFGEAWQPNYLVLTHPPVARYLIGYGLWLRGWTPDQLNTRYDSSRSVEFNRQAGNIPSAALLRDARSVVFAFAIGAVLLLYPIGRILGGPIAGLVAVALALANPLLSTLWTRALAESILAFFSLLALCLALFFLPRVGTTKVALAGPIALGLALGLATATKLSGALGAVGIVLFGLLQRVHLPRERRPLAGIEHWVDLGVVALVVFVVVNPLLYPDPVGRSVLLFEHRREEMRQQITRAPWLGTPADLTDRTLFAGRRAFVEYGTFQRWLGVPLDAPLAAAGLGLTLVATWRSLRRREPPGPPTLLLCWTLASYTLSVLNFGYNSSHYFAPLVSLNVILQALALGAVVGWVARKLPSGRLPAWSRGDARLAVRHDSVAFGD